MSCLRFPRKNRPFRIEQNAKGELEIITPVGGDGSRREAFAIRELGFWAEENGGEFFSSNGGFRLGDGSMLAADAAWVAAERWAALNAKQRRSYPPIPPDFVIEILSETDSLRVLKAKMDVWMFNKVKLAWLVDPYAATITIYRPVREPETLHKPDSIQAEAPVAGFRLTTSRLWA